MPKIHEILPVAEAREKTFGRITGETKLTFSKKQAHFVGHVRKYESIVDGHGTFDDEESYIVTNVLEKLKHFEKAAVASLDTMLTKEASNINAKADIIIKDDNGGDDITIATDVPVQALVQFGNQLIIIRDSVYNNILTLDPKNNWFPDDVRGTGYYKTAETRRRKTIKDEDFVVVVKPTAHHPAHVEKVTKDIQIGNWVESSFSGMMTPADKSDLLHRIGLLIEAVKMAKGRANQTDATPCKVASKFFKYINTGTV